MSQVSVKSMTRNYILALSILAVLSLLSFFLLRAIISTEQTSAAAINVSGRQRMLSQRIALYSLRLVVADGDMSKRGPLRRELRKAVAQMRKAHKGLKSGDTERGLPRPSDEIKTIYFGSDVNLNKQVHHYLKHATKLAKAKESELTLENKELVFILNASSRRLLKSLDGAVEQYEEESEFTTAMIQIILFGFVALILMTLLAESVLIFRPLIKKISLEAQELETAFEDEQKIAEILQRSLVPKETPKIEGLALAYYYHSSTRRAEVGGDFYDFFKVDEDSWIFVVGDVQGHGIDAAAETARVKYLLRDRVFSGIPVLNIVPNVNETLVRQNVARFTALTLMAYNEKTSILTVVNAANPYPYVLNGDKFLEITGSPLGLFADEQYPHVDVKLTKGDMIVVHTDGLVEARKDGELYGQERARDYIRANKDKELGELLESLVDQAHQFAGADLTDDVLILALRK